MTEPIFPPAVIYCRVSTDKQVRDGHGLESQESRCRAYAEANGYTVEAVFPDDVSGAVDFMKRPGMVNLLRYIDAQPDKSYIVIFDDLKRFARDTRFHLDLRDAFRQRGAKIECLNFNFDETPEGEFFETIVAAQGQLERKQMRRQTIQKMEARMKAGYWCFPPPHGYRFEKTREHGKLMVRDEPVASILTEAIESYASGRFQGRAEVKRFLEHQPAFPKTRHNAVTHQQVHDILTNAQYAGFLNMPRWGLRMIPAKHEPLVSFATFQTVQERLKGTAYAPARKDISEDFPLRGFITCACCGKPLTACWSKGRTQKYPYYLCKTKGCAEYRKSIKRDKLEGDFEALLKDLKPAAILFTMAFEMFRDLWAEKEASIEEDRAAIQRQITQNERKVAQLVDRLVDADSQTLIKAYESRLQEMEDQKLFLAEQLSKTGQPTIPFRDAFRTAFDFLANPWNLWTSDRIEDKRAVLKLVFTDHLAYCRKEGVRTAKTTLPFKALGGFFDVGNSVVTPAELPEMPKLPSKTKRATGTLRAFPHLYRSIA